jgi:hypothetical protein
LRGDADLVHLDGRLGSWPLHPLVPVHLGRRRRLQRGGGEGGRVREGGGGTVGGRGRVSGAKTLDGANDTVRSWGTRLTRMRLCGFIYFLRATKNWMVSANRMDFHPRSLL